MKNGGWVFISHSHQDIELVRKIRNQLEELGLEPLMFYLKCLSDENEIEELIKREIDERDWFIYADSINARNSKWVKTERDYIEKLTDKKIFTIDLTANLDIQMEYIKHIARQMKVYISASHRDREIEGKIRKKLLERDMLVLSGESNIAVGAAWDTEVAEAIGDASRDGFVIILITEASMNSAAVRHEIDFALASGGKIIPVYVGRATLAPELLDKIGDTVGVHIGDNPTDEELDKILDYIFYRVEYYESDYKTSIGYRGARRVTLPAISRIDDMTFFECECLEVVTIPDSVIYITPDAFADFPNILVKCHRDSYAHGYCERNNIRFEIIEK